MIPTALASSPVLQRKIDELVDQGRDQAASVVRKLETDWIDDAVVPIGPAANGSRPAITFDQDRGQVGIAYGGRVRDFHPHAATQFGSKLGIPSAWLRESIAGSGWRRALIADVMATTLERTDIRERLLLRSVGDQVRGVLSDQYRRLSSPTIVSGFARACERVGAVPYRATASDINWSISAILPRPLEVDMGPNGVETVAVSVHIRSSDFGAGPLEISFEVLRLLCVNGLVGRSALRQVHLGPRLPDEIRLSEETYRLDTETQASAVGDVTARLLEESYVKEQLAITQKAARTVLDFEKEVGGLVRARRLLPGEAEALEKALVRSHEVEVPTGPVTRWKLAQAISWLSKGTTAERAPELERMAGALVLNGVGVGGNSDE